MPYTNLKYPLFEGGDRLSTKATAAVTGGRFLAPGGLTAGPGLTTSTNPTMINVAHAAAGAAALGIAEHDQAIGEEGITLCGSGMIVPATAGAAIAAGAQVEVGTVGKAITRATGIAVGIALMAAAADNDTIYVRLY